MVRFLYICFFFLCQTILTETGGASLYAQPHNGLPFGGYSENNKLIYGDSWERWPYAFIDTDGSPQGFNVELMSTMLKRLGIPFGIYLNSQKRADIALLDYSDVSIGFTSSPLPPSWHFGKTNIYKFKNYILVPRADSTKIVTIEQLRGRKVAVRSASRSLDYLRKKGFPDSTLTIVSNMETEILREAVAGEGGAISDGVLLQCVLNKYRLNDRFAMVPIEMPVGEYRFMSQDTALLAKLDSLCAVMQADHEIDHILNKWIYKEPEQVKKSVFIVTLFWIMVFLGICFFLIFSLRYYYRHYSRKTLNDVRLQMELVLGNCNMNVWMYFPQSRRYAWMTSDGIVNEYHTSFEFSKFYPDDDFNVIHNVVMEFLAGNIDPVTKTLRCYSFANTDDVKDVEVRMEVLRNEYGKVYLVCGVQYDITETKGVTKRIKRNFDRDFTTFTMSQHTVINFNNKGELVKINQAGCYMMGIEDLDAFVANGYTIRDVAILSGIDVDSNLLHQSFCRKVTVDDMSAEKFFDARSAYAANQEKRNFVINPNEAGASGTHRRDGLYEIHLIRNVESNGNTINYMLFMYDRTDISIAYGKLRVSERRSQAMKEDTQALDTHRDYILHTTDIHTVNYNPETKTLTINDYNSNRGLTLTQIKLLSYVDATDVPKIFKVLKRLDSLHCGDIEVDIKTHMFTASNEDRWFRFSLHPYVGSDGEVILYIGTCRDITEEINVYEELVEKTNIVRQVEVIKSNFLRNTSYSLRQPLISIRQSIKVLGSGATKQMEEDIVNNITSSVRRLLKLSDDTLLLSRIESGLLTIRREPQDFVQLFKDTANEVFDEYRLNTVEYNVECIHDSLMLYIDTIILKRILHEAISLAARYISVGTLTVRYIYLKGTLTIVVMDNGQGIPPNVFSQLFVARIGEEYTMQAQAHLSGLEMPICKALIDMLGGTLEIDSDPGYGTSIYIQLNVKQDEGPDLPIVEWAKRSHRM